MSALEAVEAEAKATASTEVVMRGKTLRLLPTRAWPGSCLKDIAANDFDAWASKALEPKSYTIWNDLDPTIGEIEDFFVAVNAATGQDMGKSSASPRSSKSTARR